MPHPSLRCRATDPCPAPPVAAVQAAPELISVHPLATGRPIGTLLCADHLAVEIDKLLMSVQPEPTP